MSFSVERRRGRGEDLHATGFIEARRSVFLMELEGACAVLGSTQSAHILDPDAVEHSGRQVTTRRSGGGLVVMNPGEVLWVDVVIPAGDPLWRDDVSSAGAWLGELWVDALHDAGEIADSGSFEVHRGPLRHRDLARTVCFAGIGAGEVVDGSAKVIGVSQRRTRHWARFQCLAYARFDPTETTGLLDDAVFGGPTSSVDRDALTRHLSASVRTVPAMDRVSDALVERLVTLR
ncbi:MAG: hypothetical protein R2689_00895 [Microthrixaceae bacterium]